MLPIVIDSVSYVMPTSWPDVPVKMYFDLLKCTMGWQQKGRYDFVELYSIITGVPYETMSRCKQGDVDRLIEPNIKWVQTPLDVEALTIPAKVKIKGQWLIVPKDLQLEAFGQKASVDAEIQRIIASDMSNVDKRFEQIVSVCCIYFYKQITGSVDFDLDKALEQRKWIENAPICEMYPVAVFFSQRSTALMTSNTEPLGSGRTGMRFWRGLKSLIGTRSKRSTASPVVM